jgi:cysteinyl-tRNA synthetase
VCGPTVYNYAHIGNARPAVVFDLLHRLLQLHFEQVIYARNITDVDDKINEAAARLGVPIATISTKYTDAYHEDMAAIGVRPPTIEPRATAHIAPMIGMIQRLLKAGCAYEAASHVLFDIEAFGAYGRLSGRDMREMIAGSRVEIAPLKRNPGDFVLWKPSVDPQPGWDSPWGWGRPGWHLECSVMAEAHLGETIDIHGGGQDLIFRITKTSSCRACFYQGKPLAATGCTMASSRSTNARCPNRWATRWSCMTCCNSIRARCCATCCSARITASRWTGRNRNWSARGARWTACTACCARPVTALGPSRPTRNPAKPS